MKFKRRKKKYSELEISQSFLRLSRSSLLSLNIYFFRSLSAREKKGKNYNKKNRFSILAKKKRWKKSTQWDTLSISIHRDVFRTEKEGERKIENEKELHALFNVYAYTFSFGDWLMRWSFSYCSYFFFIFECAHHLTSLPFVLIFKNKY